MRRVGRALMLSMILVLGAVPVAPVRVTAVPQTPAADVTKLTDAELAAFVEDVGLRTTQMSRRVYGYSYTETSTERETDAQGRVEREKSETYQVSPVAIGKGYRGFYSRVQVAENGVPLSPEKIERERAETLKRFTKADDKAAHDTARPPSPKFESFGIQVQERRRGGLQKNNWSVNPTGFLLSHEFYNSRRTTLDGRACILLNFRPRANFVYDRLNFPFQDAIDRYAQTMRQLGGRVWIDEGDKVIVRLEAAPLAEVEKAGDAPDANAPLGFTSQRLPDGVWMPRRNWYNSYGREAVFWQTGINQMREFSDFKAFNTDAEAGKLGATPN